MLGESVLNGVSDERQQASVAPRRLRVTLTLSEFCIPPHGLGQELVVKPECESSAL